MLITLKHKKAVEVCEKHSFIELTNVVGTHWNCLYEAISMCTNNICCCQSVLNTCHNKANCLYLHDSYINKFDFMNNAFAKLVLGWL